MTGRVAGKAALISGAATGIGQSIAMRLAAEGAAVAVADIDALRGGEVVAEIQAAGGEATFIALDVTNEDAWRGAVGAVESAFGHLDILVNNAGIAIIESVDKMSLEDWRAVMAVNIDGVFLGTKHAVPAMRRAGGGSIINISSILGLTGEEKLSAYSASKGAVHVLSQDLRHDLKGTGIRVTEVSPGRTATEIFATMTDDQAAQTAMAEGFEIITAEDVAEAVVWALDQPWRVNVSLIELTATEQIPGGVGIHPVT